MKEIILKTTNFIKKHNNIFVVMLFFTAIFGITLDAIFFSADEL